MPRARVRFQCTLSIERRRCMSGASGAPLGLGLTGMGLGLMPAKLATWTMSSAEGRRTAPLNDPWREGEGAGAACEVILLGRVQRASTRWYEAAALRIGRRRTDLGSKSGDHPTPTHNFTPRFGKV